MYNIGPDLKLSGCRSVYWGFGSFAFKAIQSCSARDHVDGRWKIQVLWPSMFPPRIYQTWIRVQVGASAGPRQGQQSHLVPRSWDAILPTCLFSRSTTRSNHIDDMVASLGGLWAFSLLLHSCDSRRLATTQIRIDPLTSQAHTKPKSRYNCTVHSQQQLPAEVLNYRPHVLYQSSNT